MEEFVAYTSRVRSAAYIAAILLIASVFLWILAGNVPPSDLKDVSLVEVRAVGLIIVAMLAYSAAGHARFWWSNTEELRIGHRGILYRRWSEQWIPWHEIKSVTQARSSGHKLIRLYLNNPAHFPGKRVIHKLLGRSISLLSDGDIAISLLTTDRSCREAMAAIAKFRPASSKV